MKYFVAVLLSFFALTSFAQQVTLSGIVTTEGGKPVPFASIVIKGTSKGTSANSDGHYAFNIAPGNYELFYKAIGYKQVNRKIELTTNRTVNVTLPAETYQLNGVVISSGGEDPAYGIIRKAIRKRSYYLNQIKNYSCYTYIKVLQRSLDAPKKFMGRDLNQFGREAGLDSNRRGIMYFSESQSKLDFKQPDLFHEELISSKVSGASNIPSFNRAYALQINFYQNQQNWPGLSNRGVVSPIADNALSYYKYKLIGTIEENGMTINKIQVMAKRNYDPVFEGYVYIIDGSWRLYSANLTITKKAGINFLDTLSIKEQFVTVKRDTWVPSNIEINFTGGFLKFRFGGYLVSFYRDYDLNPKFDDKEFQEKVRITNEVMRKDSSYWNSQRPIPLTDEEHTDYERKAILEKRHQSKEYLDSVDKANNKIGPVNILATGINVQNRYRQEFFRVKSIGQSLFYNTVEGAGINYGATYIKKIDSTTSRFITLNGNLRYGFVNKLFHANVNGSFPVGEFRFGFNLGSDVMDINNQQPLSPQFNSIYSLLFRENYLKLYDKHFGAFSVSRRITGAWQASATVEYANRKWLPNTSFYSFFNRDKQYTSNNPFTPQQEYTPLFPENQSFKINLSTSYDFSRQYVTYPAGRFYLPSKYPRIEVSYTKAIPNVFGSDADYDLLTASVSKADVVLGNYGKFSFFLGAGKFLRTNNLYYTDYKHFNGSQIVFNKSNLNSFLLLDYYDYSTSDKYVEAHLEHNFSGIFLSRIPLLQKLKLQEIVNFNYLSTPQLKNYSELGVGLQYFAFRAMYGWSFNRQNNAAQAIRLSVTFR
ncbi:DUF5686 and carboxypeptidase regulatory-like domain-containing protein [Mucilaginibacter koreensis]